jgi:Mn2+ and Fe2+ transporters of the NRAMP family
MPADSERISGYLKTLGPGLLYAGAAIGVSHLVQSTRAGAEYGFGLIAFVIIANILKFPFFEYGPRYAVATNESLIEGYKRLGNWAVFFFVLITVGTMFAIQAAVTVVTAGLAAHLFGLGLGPVSWSAIILVICFLVLGVGQFRTLDLLIKVIIVTLAIATIVAVVAASRLGLESGSGNPFLGSWSALPFGFVIALMGWMPAPLDIAVWHSVWTQEKRQASGHNPQLRESMFDFHVGFWGAALLSVCFLALGALVLYGSAEALPDKGSAFAARFVDLYTQSLGSWAYGLIGIAALTTMFSTTITVLDAYPRVLQRTMVMLMPELAISPQSRTGYWLWMLLVAAGAVVLLAFLSESMTFMVDLATILSFLTAPVLAIMNYRMITSRQVPADFQPGQRMRLLSMVGIGFLLVFSVAYLIWQIAGF